MNQRKNLKKNAFWFKRFSGKAYGAFNSMHRIVHISVATGFVLATVPAIGISAQTKTENQKTTSGYRTVHLCQQKSSLRLGSAK